MIKSEKYRKPPPIKLPALADRESPEYLNTYAKELHEMEEAKLEDKREQLASMLQDGSFRAYLNSGRKPGQLKAGQAGKRKRKAPTAKQAGELEAGAQFEEGGVLWEVLKVQWDDELDSIIVFYCDKWAVEHAMIDPDELDEVDHENAEHSASS